MLHRDHTYVSGSFSVHQAAINILPIPYYRYYQSDTKRPLPTSTKMLWDGVSQDCHTSKQKQRRTCHWEEL